MRIHTPLSPGSVMHSTCWLLIAIVGVLATARLHATDDSALDAIVSLVASAPADEAILARATRWARDQGRIPDLIDAIGEHGRQHRSLSTLNAAVAMATEDGWVQRAVQLLEAALELDESAVTRHRLARMWLVGGWPEEARRIAGQQLESSPFADIRLGLQLLEGSTLPTTADGTATDTIQLLADRSGHWRWASRILQQRGQLDAALEVAISGGLGNDARALLDSGAVPRQGPMSLRLARLLGEDRWNTRALIEQASEAGARWRASMGIEAMLRSNPYRRDQLPSLAKVIDHLDANDEQRARRAVALWRLGGGGETRQDVSTRLILDDLRPRWLGPDRLPESIERQLRRSIDPLDASRAVAAALRAFEGTPMESSLWFQAGRLAKNWDWIERSIRISPGATFAFEWLPGIEARWKLPFESTTWTRETIISDPSQFLPVATLPPPGALLGIADGEPVRRPGHPPRSPRFSLQQWQLTDAGEATMETDAVVQLRITDGAWLLGDAQSLQLIEVARSRQRVQLQLASLDGQPLIGPDAIPRASILARIYGDSVQEELLRVATEPPLMGASMRSFCEAAARRARDSTLMKWIDFRAAADSGWWVDVAGVSGFFATEDSAAKPRSLPAQRSPSAQRSSTPGPLPAASLILQSTRRHGIQPSASRPQIGFTDAPQPLLPAGEQLLVAAGYGDRVVVTDSGLVGYFEQGSARALWWKEVLQPPLPGVGGFAPLPAATLRPDLPWADAVTPRLIEVTGADGSPRFLLLTDSPTVIDAHHVEEMTARDPAPQGYAGGTIDGDGQLLLLDALGQELETLRGVHSLPGKGAYQLVSTSIGTYILGHDRGETWLAHFNGESVKRISPPPLPDERDRPHLRVASLGRWGDEVLLLADRLWHLDEDGVSHRALTDAPGEGVYRPVHWVQPPPQLEGDQVSIARPWGVIETWGAP
ncbi:MAG: hypothetical protein VX949_05050 [Planctomycetota bacterium]|nr:hypothetical protein [Planctomycetota bacterium]